MLIWVAIGVLVWLAVLVCGWAVVRSAGIADRRASPPERSKVRLIGRP